MSCPVSPKNVCAHISQAAANRLVATALAGVTTGALTFGSFVDVPTLLHLVETNDLETLKRFFPAWWPHGRHMMVGMIGLGTAAHALAYHQSGNKTWLWTSALLFSLLPYTALVMGKEIQALREGSGDVAANTRSFCSKHHVRLVIAGTAFSMSLCALLRK